VSELVEALAQIQALLPIVHKGETAEVPTKSGGRYSYSYADLSDVVKAVYPVLATVGLAFVSRPKFVDGRYLLIGQLEHKSGEFRDAEFPLPERGTPQELGSAITYGRRYLLGCLTGVVTGDQDDDGAAASTARKQERIPDPKTATRSLIKQAGDERGWSISDLEADFTLWSQGVSIRDAEIEQLTGYLAFVKQGVSA